SNDEITFDVFEAFLFLFDSPLSNISHLTFPFQLLQAFSFFFLTLVSFLVPSLSLLLFIFLFVQEIIPYLLFHLALPFLMHILFHIRIWIRMHSFLYSSYPFPHQPLASHSVPYLEMLKLLVYKPLYMLFLLLYHLKYLIHPFYTFLYNDSLPLLPFRIVHTKIPPVSQYLPAFLVGLSL